MDEVNVVDVTDLYFIELMEWLRVMIWKEIDVIVLHKLAFLIENGNKSVDKMDKAYKLEIKSTHKALSNEPLWKVMHWVLPCPLSSLVTEIHETSNGGPGCNPEEMRRGNPCYS